MSAATDILNAVKTLVEAALPPRKVFVRRASEKNPELWFDMATPCFAVNCNDDRKTSMAWAGKKFVEYVAILTYFTAELPGGRDSSEDIEGTLDTASKLFLKPGLTGVAVVNDCNVMPMAPYKLPFKNQVVNASQLRLVFETIENAN